MKSHNQRKVVRQIHPCSPNISKAYLFHQDVPEVLLLLVIIEVIHDGKYQRKEKIQPRALLSGGKIHFLFRIGKAKCVQNLVELTEDVPYPKRRKIKKNRKYAVLNL